MKLVDPTHQRQFLDIGLDRGVVQAGPVHRHQLALPTHGEREAGLEQGPPLLYRERASPLAKKSRSTVSSPIFWSSSASRSEVGPALAGSVSKARGRFCSRCCRHL